jgi:hypothetical protein
MHKRGYHLINTTPTGIYSNGFEMTPNSIPILDKNGKLNTEVLKFDKGSFYQDKYEPAKLEATLRNDYSPINEDK